MKFNIVIFLFSFILFFLMILFIIMNNNNNKFLNEENYVEFDFFIDSYKINEDNGWLLLEALLNKSMTFDESMILVDNYKQKNGCSWWPKEFNNKKHYFGIPFKLYLDSDVTAWCYKLENDFFSDENLTHFLVESHLIGEFEELCTLTNCSSNKVIKVWNSKHWDEDIDLVATANVISSLDLNNSNQKEIFETNAKLINYALQDSNFDNLFKYYEPKVMGYVLLEYYDSNYNSFLDDESKLIVNNYINSHELDLTLQNATSKWGGDDNKYFGIEIKFINSNINVLLFDYLN